jgi:HNH endonuclease
MACRAIPSIMRHGTRTVFRACACGCGENVPPYISPTSKRVEGYPRFVPGHGQKDWGKRWAERLKEQGNPNAKPVGSKRYRCDGYVLIKCADGKWRYEHRVVANAPSDKVVHHINGDTSDNSPVNLQVIDPGEHTIKHLAIATWSRLYAACVKCGTTERTHAGQGRCTRCWQRANKERLGYWP